MLKFLSNSFERMCTILAWLNLIIWTVIGACSGYFIATSIITVSGALIAFVTIGIAIGGAFIGLIGDTLVFGFFAQVIEIKKAVQK